VLSGVSWGVPLVAAPPQVPSWGAVELITAGRALKRKPGVRRKLIALIFPLLPCVASSFHAGNVKSVGRRSWQSVTIRIPRDSHAIVTVLLVSLLTHSWRAIPFYGTAEE
jgi:hypothetical protein